MEIITIHNDNILTSINKVQQWYIQGKDKVEIFNFLLDEILKLTGSEYGFIGEILYEQNGDPYLRTMAITNIAWNVDMQEKYGIDKGYGWIFKNKDTLFGLAMNTGETIISNDPTHDPRRGATLKTPKHHPPLNSFMGIPFHYDSKLIGMVGIANKIGGYHSQLQSELEPFINTCSTLIYSIRLQGQQVQHNREKNEFILRINHEIRTPLNIILGYTQILEDYTSTLPENIQNYFKYIKNSSYELKELVDEISDLNRPDITTVINNKVNYNNIISDVVESLHPLASEHQITMNIVNKIPGFILGDSTRFRQVITNLIINAIKYNKYNGYINIEQVLSPDDKLTINIIDNGIGIGEEHLDKIFDTFYRVNNETVFGSGLGLSIVKKYVKIMNGEYGVVSKLGEGSRFWVTFDYI